VDEDKGGGGGGVMGRLCQGLREAVPTRSNALRGHYGPKKNKTWVQDEARSLKSDPWAQKEGTEKRGGKNAVGTRKRRRMNTQKSWHYSLSCSKKGGAACKIHGGEENGMAKDVARGGIWKTEKQVGKTHK